MPPKRRRVGEKTDAPNKKQAVPVPFDLSNPMIISELIEAVIKQFRRKDLLSACLVCSQWFNVVKKNGLEYMIKYMKEYGGHSALSYETITEDPQQIEDVFSKFTWKQKYEFCKSEVAKMNDKKKRMAEDPEMVDQILTVWAAENGHYSFLKKLIRDGHYSNLEYYEGSNIVEIIKKRKDYKTLKVIMTDLPQDLRDELDLFVILTKAVSDNDIIMAKKFFKYGFKCDKEVGDTCVISAVLSKNYEMMKLLSNNNAAYYREDLAELIVDLGWTDINWIK
eukprot:TRINITY_DN6891_c0_g1_i1.p1 TRINITY_DN6891_c0_g1~~TRINITY_DN6891_c0_g1_i1.p1  ORF type:complete len:279 (-),score=22.59 TRINITY_DN6891_c0_g1_i1:20-856(-)